MGSSPTGPGLRVIGLWAGKAPVGLRLMHEYVIARGVIDSLLKAVSGSGRRIRDFRVVVGELSMLNMELLNEALTRLLEASELRGAGFRMEVEPASVGCGSCGFSMSFREAVSGLSEEEKEMIHFIPDLLASYTSCKRCGSLDLRIVSGRGVSVRDVSILEQ
ncbi:MAG: hydrogenase/urease maturation nickel metallochaperone HypA [Nitrososphaerota archaeon]